MKSHWAERVTAALMILAIVVLSGGAALWLLTHGDFSFAETAYFALITVSTVGFAEPPQLHNYSGTRGVIAGLIVSGVVALAFFESTMTAMLVEGVIGKAFRRRRMQRKLTDISDHYIVAGCGRTGRFCVEELMALHHPVVVIDKDSDMLEHLSDEHYAGRLLHVAGDATEDHALIAAGVSRAKGLVAALTEDRDNLFVVLSARQLNPGLLIVAKSLETENESKLLKAGANKLVSPHKIGGFRLVSELVRPRTMAFLDSMQAMTQRNLHMEDILLEPKSELVGKTLRNAPIREMTHALVVAISEPDGELIHNPSADHELKSGAHLIAVGDEASVKTLRALAARARG